MARRSPDGILWRGGDADAAEYRNTCVTWSCASGGPSEGHLGGGEPAGGDCRSPVVGAGPVNLLVHEINPVKTQEPASLIGIPILHTAGKKPQKLFSPAVQQGTSTVKRTHSC